MGIYCRFFKYIFGVLEVFYICGILSERKRLEVIEIVRRSYCFFLVNVNRKNRVDVKCGFIWYEGWEGVGERREGNVFDLGYYINKD